MENRFRKPVNEGDEIEITIESTGAKGDGIAKVNNFVIIVPGAKEGEHVKVRITRVLNKMAFAELISEGSTPEKAQEEEETSSEENEDTTSNNEENYEEENQ